MKKIVGKAGIIATSIIALILIGIFTVCTFAIPFPKESVGVLVTAYVFTDIVIVIEALLVIICLFLESDGNQKVLGLPVVYIGFITLIIQSALSVIYMVINAFAVMPSWIVVVLEVIILGFAAIQIVFAFFFKARSREYHQKRANTEFIDTYRARLRAICTINKDQEIRRDLENLVDTARGSDPISSSHTANSEDELLSLLQELDSAIKNGDSISAKEAIERSRAALIERNELAKLAK